MTDILVIDDDPVYGDLTLQRLEATAYSAEFYLGPFGTLARVRQVLPRLLVLDVNMPALSGVGLAELVRKTRGLGDMKLMLHSSMSQDALDALVRQKLAHAALHKSATAEEFLTTVEQLLRGRPPGRRL